jgi:hypothetical protein
MNELLARKLDVDDDATLWEAALQIILTEFRDAGGKVAEVGRCSHWRAPHGAWWRPNGLQFSYPAGYGGGSYWGKPKFDWSVVLILDSGTWKIAAKPVKVTMRLVIPARTARHKQAAIPSMWKVGNKQRTRFFGFRKKDAGWQLVVTSQEVRETHDETVTTHAAKRKKNAQRRAEKSFKENRTRTPGPIIDGGPSS